MSIYDDLIAAMEPGLDSEAVVVGAFITAVKSTKRCGLSTTLRPEGRPHAAPAMKKPGELSGMPLFDLARLVFSKLPMEASLGMAAINAALPLGDLNPVEKNGAELLMEKAEEANLVMVGHFSFVHKITPKTRSTAILELDPREDELPASAAKRVIPEADVVAITGSAFSNHTIEPLLELCRGKWVMAIGPTAPLSPVLFDYGVDAIAGSVVSDPDLTLRQAGQGAIFKQLTGASRVLLVKE